MISRTAKKINVSYARYLKKRLADKHIDPDELSHAEVHSRRVLFFKKFIIKLIIVSLLLVLFLPLLTKNLNGFKFDLSGDNKESIDGNVDKEVYEEVEDKENIPVMKNPKFYGNDDNARPYNIEASSGVSVNERKIVLIDIEGEMFLQNNKQIYMKSDQGDYFIKDREISLNGGVEIELHKEYHFKTDSAYIKLKENMATGSEKVVINGKLGEITANGFNIRNSGDEILFFGGVKLNANTKEIQSEF